MKKKVLMLLFAVFSVIGMNSITTHAADVQPVEVNQEFEAFSLQQEWYSFKIEQQGKITIKPISFNLYPIDWGMGIYKTDEDGNDVYVGGIWNTTEKHFRLPKGEYKFRFSSPKYYGGEELTAKVIIAYEPENPDYYETEENNSFKYANKIVLNREYTGNIQTGEDKDFFKFELEQPGSLMVNFRLDKAESYHRWKIYLYKEDENYNKNLIEWNYNDSKKNTKFTKYRLPKGTYYICVEGFSNSDFDTSEYKIGTTYVDESSQNTEKEYNDTVDTANKINTNIEYSGNLSNDDDVDYFTFNLTSAKTINVKLKQDADEIKDKAYFVEVYNAAKNGQYRLCNSFYTKANVMTQGGKIQVPAGKYIVKVSTTISANDKEDYGLLVEETNASNFLNVNTEPYDVEGTHILLDATICDIEKNGSEYTFAINRGGYIKIENQDRNNGIYFILYSMNEDGDIEQIGQGEVYARESTTLKLESGSYVIIISDCYYRYNIDSVKISYTKNNPNATKKKAIKLAKATISAKNLKGRKVKVTLKNKINGASGYEYYYATNRSFVGKKKKRTKATSVTFRKLKKKKNYYFKVRSYRISGGKTVYSSWSNVKKVKVKK